MNYLTVLLQGGGIIPRGTQQSVFSQMFWVFTGLGAIFGVVVIGYLIWKAYQYRAGGGASDDDSVDRPLLGELPTGSDGGRHLLVSFSISGIVVISLIVWSYGSLLYIAQGAAQHPPSNAQDRTDVTVIGHQFYWEFQYHNVTGQDETFNTTGTLRVPANSFVYLTITSADVFHNFGIPKLKVKKDAVPGQETNTWIDTKKTGTYEARCYELCGQGHSYMTAKVIVMKPKAFHAWAKKQAANASASNSTSANSVGA